ncbi:hypothetical protein [Leptospira saintgironsiae]|uniref:hypothetical protein n=1 Tax=Leptospira saintgironsiae TaxID=2023183 RepID=UPI0013FDB7C8|nr:hypothetical protein [Leptospira saintgironsiae]
MDTGGVGDTSPAFYGITWTCTTPTIWFTCNPGNAVMLWYAGIRKITLALPTVDPETLQLIGLEKGQPSR